MDACSNPRVTSTSMKIIYICEVHMAATVVVQGVCGCCTSIKALPIRPVLRSRCSECDLPSTTVAHSPKPMNPPCATESRKVQSPKNTKDEPSKSTKSPEMSGTLKPGKIPHQENLNRTTPFIGSPWGGRQGASPMSPENGSRHVQVEGVGFSSLQCCSCG